MSAADESLLDLSLPCLPFDVKIPLLPLSRKDTLIRHPSFLLLISLFLLRKTSHYTSTRLPLLTLNVFWHLTKSRQRFSVLPFKGLSLPRQLNTQFGLLNLSKHCSYLQSGVEMFMVVVWSSGSSGKVVKKITSRCVPSSNHRILTVINYLFR